jgi:hypothetical protein
MKESKPVLPAKVKLVVVTGPFELSEHLAKDFKVLGARGFTTMTVNGSGAHGARKYGILDGANVRFEIVATPALAKKVLDHVTTAFEGQAVVAYALDCEAVPGDHFA